MLKSLFSLIGGLILINAAGAAELPEISAEALNTSSQLRVIDVRSAEEYASGHIPGAINIPHDQIASAIERVGAKGEDIVLYCRSGRRVAMAADTLLAAGFTRLRHLAGDYPGWVAAKLPINP